MQYTLRHTARSESGRLGTRQVAGARRRSESRSWRISTQQYLCAVFLCWKTPGSSPAATEAAPLLEAFQQAVIHVAMTLSCPLAAASAPLATALQVCAASVGTCCLTCHNLSYRDWCCTVVPLPPLCVLLQVQQTAESLLLSGVCECAATSKPLRWKFTAGLLNELDLDLGDTSS